MLILNATTTVKSIMTDKGALISILPGELSQLMTASKNLIISAINLGTPDEIGVILGGSYEFEIAGKISGSTPYLYTDVTEAKAKLLKENVDYKGNLNASKVNKLNEEEIQKLKAANELDKQLIAELKEKLRLAEANDYKSELESTVVKLESELKEANAMKLNLDGRLKESQDQVDNLTRNLNDVRSELGTKTQELASSAAMIDKLSQNIEELKSTPAESVDVKESPEYVELKEYALSLESQIKEKDTKISQLSTNLSESAQIIEDMKSEFNAACSKFGIYKDDSGEWVMEEN